MTCELNNPKVCLGNATPGWSSCVLCLRAEAREKHRAGEITAAELGAVLTETSGGDR